MTSFKKFKETFSKNCLKKVFFSDFDVLPRFGKTKLGWQVFYGKTSENKRLILEIAAQIKPTIKTIVNEEKINIVGFIPHSLPRKIAFLPFLKENLNLRLPELNLVKAYSGEIRVAQKSLPKLENRIENARETIVINKLPWENLDNKRVLLIDDAVGSGATFQETALKLKKISPSITVFAYAVVGSLKGFKVIREV